MRSLFRSTKMLSMNRPLPSMLMAISWRFNVAVNSSLVNWLPPAFARAGSGRY